MMRRCAIPYTRPVRARARPAALTGLSAGSRHRHGARRKPAARTGALTRRVLLAAAAAAVVVRSSESHMLAAFITGLAGLELEPQEATALRAARPCGIILFARNV